MLNEHRPATKELLAMLRGAHVDVVPPGWYSAREIRLKLRLSQGYVNQAIRRMMETGKIIETKAYKVTHVTRGPTAVPHYRFTPEALTALGLTEERP